MLHKARQAAKLIAITALLSLPMVATAQQDEGDGAALRAQFAGMQRTGGEIVAIAGNKLTVKTAEGDTAQIVTTDNTRIIKGRGITVKLADLKVGDGVMAAGNLDAPNKTLHAAILFATDAAEVKKLRDNLGKTYIAGKVTAIDLDNAKMTVERPDKVSQTIGFDETTSFKRGGRGGAGGFGGDAAAAPPADAGESITLADIKVGDNVHGIGSVKGGTFVPTQLNVATPGQHRRSNGAAPQP
jgi:predicted RNA-binding protein